MSGRQPRNDREITEKKRKHDLIDNCYGLRNKR